MPFVLLIAGIVLLTVAVRNTQDEFFHLLQGDFIGSNNYIYWVLSILIIGAMGYVPKLKPVSDGFLILVILVLFLKKDDGKTAGVFDSFNKQIKEATAQAPPSSASNPYSWTRIDGKIVQLPLSQGTLDNLGLGKPK